MLHHQASVFSLSLVAGTTLITYPALGETKIGKKASELTQYSYSAADLFTAYDPVNLKNFCERYPYNSRCQGLPASSSSEESPQSSSVSRQRSNANSGWAVTPEVSTLGVGASVSYGVTSQLNTRVGINGFSFGVDIDETRLTYDSDVNLLNISTIADYYPLKESGLKLSLGLIFNDNNVSGVATSDQSGQVNFGGQSFTVGEGGDLSSADLDVEFPNKVAPYIGIGWGNPVQPGSRWNFNINLGLMFPGSPEVDVEGNTNITLPNNIQAQLDQAEAEEEEELEEELDNFSIYPVVTVGISYQF
ncbi:MAG: hypothetical protein GVY17_09875 [Cyanobacteria bacterium]|jgi:hypothetical protein|nr:hypothetical protein [Cyanobacteria bacterium GSL.Bin21]